MDSTKSYVTAYNVSRQEVEDFEFSFSTGKSDLLLELVPEVDDWGKLAWGIELEEYEYDPQQEKLHFTLETKWESPTEWLRNASLGALCFENKLITMSTIQKDETVVHGVAVMDGDILQNKEIWSMSLEEVGKYYNDDELEYELDNLDDQIWDSVSHFRNVCEQFYLGKGPEEND